MNCFCTDHTRESCMVATDVKVAGDVDRAIHALCREQGCDKDRRNSEVQEIVDAECIGARA